jgi:hypothetical protein
MAKNDFPPVKKAESYPLGHAKEAKDASNWSYRFPQSTGTERDIGVYAQPGPNTMDSNIQYQTDPNSMNAMESTPGGMPARSVSIGNKTRGPKTEGITMRGYGAATKGIKSRGPMA